MKAAGEIVAASGLDSITSFWAALELALARDWEDEDIVYFAEDDYLFREQALAGLLQAAGQLPFDSYYAPYATIGHLMPNGEPLHEGMRRPRVSEEPVAEGGGVTWYRGLSHTGSFAVRVGTLRADMPVFRIAPRTGGGWDHSMSLAYQGIAPYSAAAVAAPLRLEAVPLARRAKTVLWRAVLSGLALAWRRHRRLLASSRPALTSHMEVGLLAQGTDWDAEARDAEAWANDRSPA
jgi:hypothetical protein